MSLRLVFMGTPDFSVPALKSLMTAGYEICAVYTQPPRAANRGKKQTRTPVHKAAEEAGLRVFHPASLTGEDTQGQFANLRPDAAIVVAYGLLLPAAILQIPPLGCLNIHASLLPRWRGAAPIQRAIEAGDTRTGISIMQMEEGLDTGPVLMQEAIKIQEDATGRTLHDALSDLGSRMIVQTLKELTAGTLHPGAQPESGITYARKLTKQEGRVDFSCDSRMIDRQVRALTPWPGCFFNQGNERVKVLSVSLSSEYSKTPSGTILSPEGLVSCGTGSILLNQVQRPGRHPVTGGDFIRGLRLSVGDILGDILGSTS